MKHSLNKLIFGLVLVAASQANAMEEFAQGILGTVAETVAPKVTEAVAGETGNSLFGYVWGVAKATPGFALDVAKATPGVVADYATRSERLNATTNAVIGGIATVLQDDPYFAREVLGAAALTATTLGVRSAYNRRARAIEAQQNRLDTLHQVAKEAAEYVALKEADLILEEGMNLFQDSQKTILQEEQDRALATKLQAEENKKATATTATKRPVRPTRTKKETTKKRPVRPTTTAKSTTVATSTTPASTKELRRKLAKAKRTGNRSEQRRLRALLSK